MPKTKCAYADKYTGKKPPKCGCDACRDIYIKATVNSAIVTLTNRIGALFK